MAGIYPCSGYDLLGRIPLSAFGAMAANDIWGWTDPMTQKEYALIGLDNGTAYEYRVSTVCEQDTVMVESLASPGVLVTPQAGR